MLQFLSMSESELLKVKADLEDRYNQFKAQGLKLNMARGKPATDQLNLSMKMLDTLNSGSDMHSSTGDDCRNYGLPDGLPELRELFAELMGVDDNNIIVGGNSSLNMMFDAVSCAMTHGFAGCEPWGKQGHIKFLCPSPGYDRHFAITEYFGFELIAVPMLATGPDMDVVEKLIHDDASVKGIWCVPKYSNPTGITYSDETVRRFAALKPAAKDFRIFWDNAYCVHDLTDTPDTLLNLWQECRKNNTIDLPIFFASTSKITFPGAGIAAMGASEKNLSVLREHYSFQTIGPDKLNQLRHIYFLKDLDGVMDHMTKHRALLEPKFRTVLGRLESELGGKGVAEWTSPNGGYFVSVDVLNGCAKRVVSLCKEAGVTLTGAGATYPYGKDPNDQNIRVAPTYPPVAELEQAMELFCICVQLAAAEKLLNK
ncbi:aminotransferase class I/II-fold pyridoxal phosphate-dependent enzyme [Caproiciproducens faecalis]|uniref:Aminotransferase class I/II-fold pyridoxal phosphate-dependent enzyme n=1 Tax=Caproiciproducens faecalis TaxID=2820301 RepID=A0ABS7DQT3_9FIRM|nr:aminotransferase class I/II-fold pyridoxal phosphate-dependent enzyme [Caproiciproducens faecalis]MBW7573667.1 aminotransferase class I/II-fold pyridoxal phosphate-dependent enzyme [Caproiciproducens faecalis]